LIKAGDGVILSNQSANRDETVFKDPDTSNIRSPLGKQVGYGSGTHVCVARPLADAELQCVFGMSYLLSRLTPLMRSISGTLFQKVPTLKLAIPMNEIKYTPLQQDVGVIELPVTWV